MFHDLRPFIQTTIRRTLAHAIPGQPGAFSRRSWSEKKEGTKQPVTDVYGCADAVHVLYTLQALPLNGAERSALITRLQSFQDETDGLFRGTALHFLHTTAFASGALELLDARPKATATGLEVYASREGIRGLMESLDWASNPWAESHRGAGVYASMLFAGKPGADWEQWYFEWLWDNQDSKTGLWRRGCINTTTDGGKGAPLFHHLASSFHYLFNHDYGRRPLHYTEPLIDTCLSMDAKGCLPPMGKGLSWNEIDWLYTLRSLQKRSPYRSAEISAQIQKVAEQLIPSVMELDPETSEAVDDLHTLFAGLSALAVIQESLPGSLLTPAPLRLVLERKPFL
jgi:hypothetical protein